jgi:hypothetical protein
MNRKLRPGQFVFTFGGERLGSVARVDGDRFLVENGDSGHWLRADAVLEADTRSARLICNRSRIASYLLPDPVVQDAAG